MKPKIGIIFLDGAEVIVGIYVLNRHLKWEKIFYQVRDLTTFDPKKPIDYLDILEVLTERLYFGLKSGIKDWQIIARNLSDEILNSLSQATKLEIKILGLKDEQELICRGILSEV